MKSSLFFGVNLKFDLSINVMLKGVATFSMWDPGLKRYLFIFPINKLDEVIKVTGQDVNFDDEKDNILEILQHSPTLKKDVELDKYKTTGYLHIQRFPKLFIINTVISKKDRTFKIPLESAKAAWRAVRYYQIGVPVHAKKKLSEKWCKEMGITRFNRPDSGSYDSNKFSGTRKDYFKFYYPLKILQSDKAISYSKTGMVTRLKESWEYDGILY